MRPSDFPKRTRIVGPPKGMINCGDLPVQETREGYTSFWRFSEDELKQVIKTGGVYVKVHAGGVILPVLVSVSNPNPNYVSQFYSCFYRPIVSLDNQTHGVWVWVNADAPPPMSFILNDRTYVPDTQKLPKFEPSKDLAHKDVWVGIVSNQVHVLQRQITDVVGEDGSVIENLPVDYILECAWPNTFDPEVKED